MIETLPLVICDTLFVENLAPYSLGILPSTRARYGAMWLVDDVAATLIERVLTSYDQQPTSAAIWIALKAQSPLERLVDTDGTHPVFYR